MVENFKIFFMGIQDKARVNHKINVKKSNNFRIFPMTLSMFKSTSSVTKYYIITKHVCVCVCVCVSMRKKKVGKLKYK